MKSVSYSGLQLYTRCPYAFDQKYNQGILTTPREAGPAATRGSNIHQTIEDYLVGKTKLLAPDFFPFYHKFLGVLKEQPALSVEGKFNYHPGWEPKEFWDTEGGLIRGLVDARLLDGDTAHVYEWKSGRVYPDHGDQRCLYALDGLLKYPQAEKVIVTSVYLDLKHNVPAEYERSKVPGMKWLWEQKVKRTRPPQRYPKRPGRHCNSCGHNKKHGGTCVGNAS